MIISLLTEICNGYTEKISKIFIILTIIIGIIMIAISDEITEINLNILLIGISISLFRTSNILIFYILFEVILVPLYILINKYGYEDSRNEASKTLFIYTAIGGIIWLVGIVSININIGTNEYINLRLSENSQFFLFPLFYIPLLIKTPQIPLHIWLPLAHSSAPTSGSIMLAAIILKLSSYGIIKFIIPVFPYALNYYAPVLLSITVISIIYSCLTTLKQSDIKKIIAYSSIGHCNLAIYGILQHNYYGLIGCVTMSISHAIISTGLFYINGIMYKRFNTRLLPYFSGLLTILPLISFIFFLLSLANAGFPPIQSFKSETEILLSGTLFLPSITFIVGISSILSLSYSFWLFLKLFYSYPLSFSNLKSYDLIRSESSLLLLIFTLLFLISFDSFIL